MKKLLIILVSLVALNVNAQLVVREAAKDTVVWQINKLTPVPKLVKFSSEEADSYTIYYRNAQYSTITDIDYITTGDLETTKQFFELCKTVVTTGKEYNLQLDGKSISLSKTMGSTMIYMQNSYFYLAEKSITAILEKL